MLLVVDLVHYIAYLHEWFSTKCHIVVAAEVTGLFESEAACFYFRQYKKTCLESYQIFSLLSKNESRLIKSPVSVCVCVCVSVCMCVPH
jgi:hypothetical protein